MEILWVLLHPRESFSLSETEWPAELVECNVIPKYCFLSKQILFQFHDSAAAGKVRTKS